MNYEIIVLGIAIVSGFTGLIVQGIKMILKDLNKTFPKNILVGIVAIALSILLSIGYAIVFNIQVDAAYIVWTVVVIIGGWLGSMFGFDKIKQTWQQAKGGKKS